jgi:hypothetical protein
LEFVTDEAIIAPHMVELDHANQEISEQVWLDFARCRPALLLLLRIVLQVNDVSARNGKGYHSLQKIALYLGTLDTSMRLNISIKDRLVINKVIYFFNET